MTSPSLIGAAAGEIVGIAWLPLYFIGVCLVINSNIYNLSKTTNQLRAGRYTLLLKDAGRRLGLKGVSFGGSFPNSSSEHTPPSEALLSASALERRGRIFGGECRPGELWGGG